MWLKSIISDGTSIYGAFSMYYKRMQGVIKGKNIHTPVGEKS